MQPAQNSLPGCYKSALITGASSGLGKAFANRLLQEGLTVYGTSRNPLADGLNPEVHWLALDGSSTEGTQAFIDQNIELLSTVDLLVNNAGSSSFGKASEQPIVLAKSEKCLLLETPAWLTGVVLESLVKRGSGAIVNISSLAAIFPLPYMASYSSGKAGLSGFTQSLILTTPANGVILIDFQAGDYRTAFNANIRRYGEQDASMERAWRRLEANLATGPEPEKAANDLVGALKKGRSGTVRSGGFFQCRIAPLGMRLLPRRMLLWATRKYYRIG